jgi:two-component system, NarL family, response regulator LiaR
MKKTKSKNWQDLITSAEKDVLELLITGKFYKEIAEEKNVVVDTIKKHCTNMYKKMNVRNRNEATLKYKELHKSKASLPEITFG